MVETVQYRDYPLGGGRPTPLHLWVVGVVSLLWNAYGCYDYLMTKLDPVHYLAGFSAESRTYMMTFPAWITAAWAVGVWFSLLGSVLLLARSRFAVAAFGLSLLGLAASNGGQWTLPTPAEMHGPAVWGVTITIWVVLVGLVLYSRAQARAGVLR